MIYNKLSVTLYFIILILINLNYLAAKLWVRYYYQTSAPRYILK